MVVSTTYVGEEADDRSEDNLDRSGDEAMGGNLRMGGNAITEIASLADSGGTSIYDGAVVPQGKLGGPASSLSAYPLSLGGDTDTDVAGSNISDGTTTIWDATAAAIPQAQLGGPASSLSAYPLALATDTDMDLGATDLTDGTTVVWDASVAAVPQAQLGGPASSLSAYPLANSDLSNSSVTVGNATIGLGGSGNPNLDSLGAASGDIADDTGIVIYDYSQGKIPQKTVDKNGFDADLVDGYHIQKNGTDGTGVINFKT